MLIPQRGDIWMYDLRNLYAKGHYNHRVEHWLICDVGTATELAPEKKAGWYTSSDNAVAYICLETGVRDMKIFSRREWGDNLDFTGNPFYKKVA